MASGAELLVSGLTTALAAGGKIFSIESAKNQREIALKQRLQQEELATNQRKLATGDRLQRVFASQVVSQAASGFTLDSPTFGAIQRNTLNNAAKDINADNLNFEFRKTANEERQKSIRQKADIGIGTSLFDAGTTLFGEFKGAKDKGLFTSQSAIAKGSSEFNKSLFGESARRELTPFDDEGLFQDPFDRI